MAKNKKPRKRYHPKPVCIGYDPAALKKMEETWQRIELAAHLALPNGSALADDLFCIRDLFNVALVSLALREDMDNQMREDARNMIHDAGDATRDIYYRGAETKHFVAKGDELRLIREAVEVCGDYVRESIRNCPGRFMQEWATSKVLTQGKEPIAHKTVTEALVKRTFYSMTPQKFAAMTARHA